MTEALRQALRWMWIGLGLALMAVGLVGVFLPTHLLGVFLVLGLILVLRNSRSARKRFVHMHRAHPRFIHPLRRLLRREPEVLLVAWQQMLRVERLIPHPRFRVLVRGRRALRKWLKRRAHEAAARKAAQAAKAMAVAPAPLPAE